MAKTTISAALGLIPTVLLWCSDAHADIEVGVFGGYKHYSTDNSLGRPAEDPQLTPYVNTALSGSGIFGMRLAVLPIPRLAIEGELGLSPTGMRGGLYAPGAGELEATRARLAVIPVRVHLLVNLATGRIRPFLLVGGGGQISSPTSSGVLKTDAKGALHAGGGISFEVRPGWGLRFDGRLVLAQGLAEVFTPEAEGLAAIWGRFGKTPPPKPPEAAPPLLATPPPQPPPPVATQPAPPPPPPNPPPVKAPETKALPDVKTPPELQAPVDRDGDGLLDSVDRCPEQAGSPENGGCPEVDSDGDGINDRLDKCPTQPENKNAFQDDDGCPDELPAALKQFTGTIAGVGFQPFSSVITQASFKVLDQAAKALGEVPTVRIEIAGHTDPAGDPKKNRILSQQRAESVKQYLIEKGIEASRLIAAGYGSDKPRFDNATPEGRAKNRRVEFNVLAQ